LTVAGPNPVILNDFVRMLWEKRVTTVVMLTNTYEGGKVFTLLTKLQKFMCLCSPKTLKEEKLQLQLPVKYAAYEIKTFCKKKKKGSVTFL
jgi:hypothetical protein